jgi:hypothetical protein
MRIRDEAIMKSMGDAKIDIVKNKKTGVYKFTMNKEIGVYNNPLLQKERNMRKAIEECKEFRLTLMSFNE